jgi:ElaB/YqjD/DUF883 family membrane-anchored ribosome-binding protein
MNPTTSTAAGNGATAATGSNVRGLVDEARSTMQDVSAAASRGAQGVAEQTRVSASEIAHDIEALVRKIGPAASAEVKDLLATLKERASNLTHSVQDVGLRARDQAMHGAEKARDVVRDRPLQSVVAALLAGAAIGILLSRSYNNHHTDQ